MMKKLTETYSPNGIRVVVTTDSNAHNVQLVNKAIVAYEQELAEEERKREERRKQKAAERAEKEAKRAAKAAAVKPVAKAS